jgi:hypothetical protein
VAVTDFVGRWNIYEMELWAKDDIDLLGPAEIVIGARGNGTFRFIAVVGELAWRSGKRGRAEALVFTWEGTDDMDDASGSGWVRLTRAGEIVGSIAFHAGDESGFKARRVQE